MALDRRRVYGLGFLFKWARMYDAAIPSTDACLCSFVAQPP